MFGLDDPIEVGPKVVPPPVDRSTNLSQAVAREEWVATMDGLGRKRGWDDQELSAHIHISASMINHCRAGRRPIPPAARLWILHHLGFEITRARLLSAVPQGVFDAVALIDAQRVTIQREVITAYMDELDASPMKGIKARRLIEELSHLRDCDLSVLCAELGMSQADFIEVGNGVRSLPYSARVRICESLSSHELAAAIIKIG